ncbi:MAG TPA: sigma-54 dependent transcriptional regulator [Candidatus Wallbacteria bacterium]|nr:sigma-54 dependent transcriptional regulator [Candidatus Wallbacteria bacterium]
MEFNNNEIVKYAKLISSEPEMKKIFSLIDGVAPTDATILILGESGTGKELIAEAIYEKSKRVNKPFVAVNCSAVPDELIESHLFGHLRGSFTGASCDMEGKFKQADGGTLFLDEIGDMSLKMQAKILRALETREIQPIGSSKNVKVDVRVIAATNKNLDEAVAKKEFRSDLYFRINEVMIKIPPLRERINDLHLILMEMIEEYNKEFDKKISAITLAALGLLQKHNWPGNIRELRNITKRTMLLIGPGTEQIFAEHLPVNINADANNSAAESKNLTIADSLLNFLVSQSSDGLTKLNPENLLCLEELEKNYIQFVLKATKNNKSQTARILKIDRTTLYEKISKYKIETGEK